MEPKKLEDLTLFPFEKRVEGATEVISSNCLFDQMRQEVTFSKSQHHCSGTNVKALWIYFTIVSITTASAVVTVSITTTITATTVVEILLHTDPHERGSRKFGGTCALRTRWWGTLQGYSNLACYPKTSQSLPECHTHTLQLILSVTSLHVFIRI